MAKARLIGICGKARSGKDTVADFIAAENPGYYRYSFADPIRRMLRAGLNIDLSERYWQERKEEVIPALGKSPRQIMQTLGTEWGRELVHDELWLTLATAELSRRGPGMIVSDVRFDNEAQWVRRFGGILIHLDRDKLPGVALHKSENGIERLPTDFTLTNNGSLESLQIEVAQRFGGLN